MNKPVASPVPMRWASAVAAAVLVAVVSTRPGAGEPPAFVHADKLLHVLGYAGLAMLWLRASKPAGTPTVAAWKVVLVVVGVSLFGGVLELVQQTVPGRTASVLDGVANCLGAVGGVLAYTILIRKSAYFS